MKDQSAKCIHFQCGWPSHFGTMDTFLLPPLVLKFCKTSALGDPSDIWICLKHCGMGVTFPVSVTNSISFQNICCSKAVKIKALPKCAEKNKRHSDLFSVKCNDTALFLRWKYSLSRFIHDSKVDLGHIWSN